MYHSRTILFISALTTLATHTLAIPTLADTISSTTPPPPRPNPTTPPSTPTSPPQNTTHPPLTFLGIDCYHLAPDTDTVTIETCQPLFAKMFAEGNPYKEYNWWNGWQFRTGRRGPCTITLSSAARDDRHRMIRVSIADVYMYTIEVLRSCREGGTGGANTFEGAWKVEVTKFPVERAVFNGSLSEE